MPPPPPSGPWDYRDIIIGAGKDPYAYRGYKNIQVPSVRPSGQGGCDKWGGAGRKYSDEPPATPGSKTF